ncbi:MAG: isocitrate dehydrogenase, partial [Phycisphaerae bacterium]
ANLQPAVLGPKIEALLEGSALKLKMISNRGTKVYPSAGAITDCVDQYRCRCILRDGAQKGATATLTDDQLLPVLAKFGASKELSWMHIEKLQEIDGSEGFTKAQGED